MKQKTQTDLLLEGVRRIHMIGIGGSGMCPLAEILHIKGYQLTGSDNNESDTLDRIRSLGIPVKMGHDPENLGDARLVVYSAAIMQDNPELVSARERGIPTVERSLLLGAITRQFDRVYAVCGTHGKTTVTSMLTQILLKSGFDPSAVIGGKLPLIGSNGRAGSSNILVCEACEYVDTFLKMSPDVAVILNIDNDHMEYFKTIDNLIASFSKFAKSATTAVIANGDDENTRKAMAALLCPLITFGKDASSDYYPENIHDAGRANIVFDLCSKGQVLTKIELNVPGLHNVYNAVAAAAAAIHAGVTPQQAAEGLRDFRGAGRRFEVLGTPKGITVADDYAHHPAELKVTLETAASMGFDRVIAVFQPFTFSRTAMLMDDFAKVLSIADLVVLSEIMGSREMNTYGVTSAQLADKIDGSVWFPSFEEIAEHVCKIAKPGDLVITLGCGDIYKAAKMILKKLNG